MKRNRKTVLTGKSWLTVAGDRVKLLDMNLRQANGGDHELVTTVRMTVRAKRDTAMSWAGLELHPMSVTFYDGSRFTFAALITDLNMAWSRWWHWPGGRCRADLTLQISGGIKVEKA